MSSFPYLIVLLAVPAVGALVTALLPKGRETLSKQVALLFSLVTLVVAIAAALQFDRGSDQTYQLTESYSWISSFGISFSLGVSGISLSLVAMTAVLVPVCVLASWHDAEQGRGRVQTYFALVLALETLMLAVFMATDVFLFYVLFEAMLVPMYFIIGSYGGVQRSYAAVKFLLYSLLGGLLMLAALIVLYVKARQQLPAAQFPHGTFDLTVLSTQLHLGSGTEKLLFLGFFIAFAIKAPLWPLHTWLPDAAAEAPSGGAVLMVSVMDKVGTFGMIALCLPLFPQASHYFAPAIVVLAVIAVIYGALVAIGQQDLKRLIAYTSVSHFGFIILGIFAMTSQGQAGSTLYMVNHGFSTAALFLVAGMMSSRRGSRIIADFGGVQRVAPIMAGSFLIAGLSSLALPGLSSFVSEFLVLLGTFSRYRAAGIIATAGIVLAALYILLMYQRTMTGPVAPGNEGTRDLGAREAWVVAPVLAIIIALGFFPKPLLDVITPSVNRTMQTVNSVDPQPSVPVAEGTAK
ncbi:MAG: NADH-quinone oxidoreductase subunit M [Motilibacteraceae bacterium]